MESHTPELDSIEAFAQFLLDDERETFTHQDLRDLNGRLRIAVRLIRRGLESYGFKLEERPVGQHVRTVSTSSHDRWYGPGSSPTHGGSGWEQINGFAGQKG